MLALRKKICDHSDFLVSSSHVLESWKKLLKSGLSKFDSKPLLRDALLNTLYVITLFWLNSHFVVLQYFTCSRWLPTHFLTCYSSDDGWIVIWWYRLTQASDKLVKSATKDYVYCQKLQFTPAWLSYRLGHSKKDQRNRWWSNSSFLCLMRSHLFMLWKQDQREKLVIILLMAYPYFPLFVITDDLNTRIFQRRSSFFL